MGIETVNTSTQMYHVIQKDLNNLQKCINLYQTYMVLQTSYLKVRTDLDTKTDPRFSTYIAYNTNVQVDIFI